MVHLIRSFKKMWGQLGEGDGEFHFPRGVAVGENGNVYVVDTMNHRIQKFNADGAFLGKWGRFGRNEGEFFNPDGIAISSNFYVFVTDKLNNRVQKFDPNGRFLRQWGRTGTGSGEFQGPMGIAIDSDDFVYVADWFNHRIQKFSRVGEFIKEWGGTDPSGLDPKKFVNGPEGVTIDSNDNCYVTNKWNGFPLEVKQFDSDGNLLRQVFLEPSGVDKLPGGIAVFSDQDPLMPNIFMVSLSNLHMMVEYGSGVGGNLTQKGAWPIPPGEGFEEGRFALPSYIAIEKHTGNTPPANSAFFYISDSRNNRIQKFRYERGAHPPEEPE